ncbi:hypothetical protein HHL11_00700 [Ramlibacter sp. G-1-2-2]|uniref:4,5-dihydroxyphthalate decarboxylase n=1 Tax=Ramlibacter agri TaxID=2728837 RepID=A0A848GUE8_9BURK|nr:hypothetical protein [Ramlibacter agri]NML42246.1 hypothetical protein [Ramlibacter agri]
MDNTKLLAALRRYEYNDALFDGQAHEGLTLEIARYEGSLLNAMRAMLHERAYDVCEMSPSSYLIAKQAGAALIALPIFPFRQFPLDQVVVREDSKFTKPEDIAGATIAVRTWAQPTALWARQYLMDYLGLDLGGVKWMFIGDDPVPGLRRPEGSVTRKGETLEGLLASGAADVAIGLHSVPPGCRTLIADPEAASRAWRASTGVVPANHLMVVDGRHAGTAVPELVCRRMDAVVRDYLAGGAAAPGVIADLQRIAPEPDPLPSGRAANAAMWETLVGTMVRQGMLAPVASPLDLLYDWEPVFRPAPNP